MGKQLDRKRDFGTIQGDTEGRVYEQDDTFFDADGKEWVDPKERKGKAAAPAPTSAPTSAPAPGGNTQ